MGLQRAWFVVGWKGPNMDDPWTLLLVISAEGPESENAHRDLVGPPSPFIFPKFH